MMALNYGVAHLHLTFGGTLYGTETWSCGLRIAPVIGAFDTPPPIDALEDFAYARITEVGTKVETFWAAVHAVMNSKAALTWTKLAALQANGKYREGWSAPVKGVSAVIGSGGPQFPQVAIAISQTTGVARGRAHTGRFYLPLGTALEPDANGNLAAADALFLSNAGAAFVNDLNNWSGIDPGWGANVHVMSGIGSGLRHKVTGIRTGRVVDTQRRRRVNLNESYVVATTAIV